MHKISRRSGLICGNAVRQLKTAVTFGLESTLMPAITGSSYLGKNIDETNRRTDRQTDRLAGGVITLAGCWQVFVLFTRSFWTHSVAVQTGVGARASATRLLLLVGFTKRITRKSPQSRHSADHVRPLIYSSITRSPQNRLSTGTCGPWFCARLWTGLNIFVRVHLEPCASVADVAAVVLSALAESSANDYRMRIISNILVN